jgi:hypothetical protein
MLIICKDICQNQNHNHVPYAQRLHSPYNFSWCFNCCIPFTKIYIRNAHKNIRLSIQQAVIKTAIEKAKDCNAAWDKSKKFFEELEAKGTKFDKKEHYDVISELVISKEIILKSFTVYSKQDSDVIKEQEDYAYIFWKQLNTAIRGFFTSDAIRIALAFKHKTIYGDQLLGVNDFVKNHIENQDTQYLFEELKQLPEPSI